MLAASDESAESWPAGAGLRRFDRLKGMVDTILVDCERSVVSSEISYSPTCEAATRKKVRSWLLQGGKREGNQTRSVTKSSRSSQ